MANILLAGGGTGGHITPGLAVAEAAQQLDSSSRFDFACTSRPLDQTVLECWPGRKIIQPIQPFGIRPTMLFKFVTGMVKTQKLIKNWIRENQIVGVLGLGGFGSSAALQVGAKLGLKTAFLNPDFVPGKANQWLSKYSDEIFVQWQGTEPYFNRPVRVIGVPLRQNILDLAGAARAEVRKRAVEKFALDPELKTLVIMGGSTGARSLNNAVVNVLRDLDSQLAGCWQVLHITGAADFNRISESYRSMEKLTVKILAYTDQMDLAWSPADLAICRAGAITLAELTAVGIASILLPYPYHKDNHQARNANVVVQAGGSIMIEDDKVAGPKTTGELRSALEKVLFDEACRLRMIAGAKTLQRLDSAQNVARWFLRM
ncbi:MAG: UDP-N-acetylglucosamine--N-acetylmuramyl-(pentapeptide) pyrophosphoryl-undecaprenol N-acetylglucosamine transferase [Phycisphaerae bacterium]|nr:UDP-N-acetylglucosamine--N-acetylmuramyl-(pentapeptide) pyrophosphoryl-undecaprenol N-acetylglucosamine transferase [Phycisphaerae bacterium]